MSRSLAGIVLLLLVLAGAGCGSDNSDLSTYINGVKARKGGRIDPLPVPAAEQLLDGSLGRDPFQALEPATQATE